jgi:hypothetical protein
VACLCSEFVSFSFFLKGLEGFQGGLEGALVGGLVADEDVQAGGDFGQGADETENRRFGTHRWDPGGLFLGFSWVSWDLAGMVIVEIRPCFQ